MRAMVLAAGLGTRLHPLTAERPKPAVPVLGEPLISHTLSWLRTAGVSEVAVNLFHLPKVLPQLLGDGSRWGMNLHFIVEEGAIRGTGGGLLGGRRFFERGETFLLVNGDIIVDVDLQAALALHRRVGGPATMVLRRSPRAAQYGEVPVDGDGRVQCIRGRRDTTNQAGEGTMFSGVHLLEPSVFPLLPEQGCIIRSVYRHLLAQGAPVGGYVDPRPWLELGTPKDYLLGNLALAAGDVTLSYLPRTSSDASWVAPEARVASPDLLVGPSVVGAGADVRAPIDRVVVWPGAQVDQPLRDAVVTPRQTLRLTGACSS